MWPTWTTFRAAMQSWIPLCQIPNLKKALRNSGNVSLVRPKFRKIGDGYQIEAGVPGSAGPGLVFGEGDERRTPLGQEPLLNFFAQSCGLVLRTLELGSCLFMVGRGQGLRELSLNAPKILTI